MLLPTEFSAQTLMVYEVSSSKCEIVTEPSMKSTSIGLGTEDNCNAEDGTAVTASFCGSWLSNVSSVLQDI